MTNPFQLTRAADLNDKQILDLWVDPEGELGKRLRPASRLPMILLGGKGSGKTHLMRVLLGTQFSAWNTGAPTCNSA